MPKCAVPGTAAGKRQNSAYHSDSLLEYKKSDTEDVFLSECVFNRTGQLNLKSTE